MNVFEHEARHAVVAVGLECRLTRPMSATPVEGGSTWFRLPEDVSREEASEVDVAVSLAPGLANCSPEDREAARSAAARLYPRGSMDALELMSRGMARANAVLAQKGAAIAVSAISGVLRDHGVLLPAVAEAIVQAAMRPYDQPAKVASAQPAGCVNEKLEAEVVELRTRLKKFEDAAALRRATAEVRRQELIRHGRLNPREPYDVPMNDDAPRY